MSRTDILEEIKKTEASAAAKVEKAEADKKIAIADARRNSVKKIQDAEVQMHNSHESSLTKEREALSVKRDALLAEGKKEADKIDKAAILKMQTVKDFLNEEFVRTLNVNV